MAEKDFQRQILKELKKRHNDDFIYKTSDRYVSGIPDILMCINGIFVALELKWQAGTTKKLQLYNLRKIQKSGGYACILRKSKGVYRIEHDSEDFTTRDYVYDTIDELIDELELRWSHFTSQ